jgi:tetratricopeptide (TPR) repeat protein
MIIIYFILKVYNSIISFIRMVLKSFLCFLFFEYLLLIIIFNKSTKQVHDCIGEEELIKNIKLKRASKRSIFEFVAKYSHGILTDVYFAIGYVFLSLNRYEEAIVYFNLCDYYQSPDSHRRLKMLLARADSYYYQEKFVKALNDLEEGLKLRPNYYEPLTFKARCLFKMGKYTESITCYDQVTLVHNNNIDAILMERATAYEHTNQFFKAILDCDTVLTSNPNEKEALRLKGICFFLIFIWR